MFSKMHDFWYCCRFIILKSVNSIFKNQINCEDLPSEVDLASLKSFPMTKTEQKCSRTRNNTNSMKKSPLVDCSIATSAYNTKIVLLNDVSWALWHLHFRIFLWAYHLSWSLQIFFVVKKMVKLAKSSIVFIIFTLV